MGKSNKPYELEYVKEQFKNKNYTLLSKEYKNKNEKLDFICNNHIDLGIQQVSFSSFLLNKCNCSSCKSESNSKNWYTSRNFKPMTTDEFYKKHFRKYKNRLLEIVGEEYDLLNVYRKNKHTFMTLMHNTCGTIYDVESHHFFSRNQRCPYNECNSKIRSTAYMKPIKQLHQEIFELVGNEYKIVGKYKGTNNNTTFYHKLCGNTFQKTPHNFFAGQRCPHCVIPTKGEQRIIDFLELHNKKYTFQKSYDDLRGINDGLLSYDIYIDNKNVLIEYQGQFHDGTAFKEDDYKFYRQQEHDKRKREYAKIHNIKLLEIWYWDFDNIEKILEKELGLAA